MIGTRRRPEERRIQHVRLDRLQAHPLNEKIYGSALPDRDLVASIRQHGILEPLIVTGRNVIISGHRRWLAAKTICAEDQTSEKTVYLMTMRPDHMPNDAWYSDEVRDEEEDNNPLELERMIIEANRQRAKTPEQIGREFKELKRIETAVAAQRMKVGKKVNPVVCSPQGKARDIAAAKLNVSSKHAERLEDIIDAADEGNAEARAALDAVNKNEMSISAAHETVKPIPSACPRCGESFPSRSKLKQHAHEKHQIAGADFPAFLRPTPVNSVRPEPPTAAKSNEITFCAIRHKPSGQFVNSHIRACFLDITGAFPIRRIEKGMEEFDEVVGIIIASEKKTQRRFIRNKSKSALTWIVHSRDDFELVKVQASYTVTPIPLAQGNPTPEPIA